MYVGSEIEQFKVISLNLEKECVSACLLELILDKIDFVRIDFKVKWFMFGSSSKSDSNIK